MTELLLERLPGLSGAGFGHRWVGLYPESIDRRPLVAPFDGEPHLIAADWLTEGAPITLPEAAALRPGASK